MSLDPATIEQLAGELEAAERERRPLAKITDAHPQMDVSDAYAVQRALRARKERRGLRVAGLKMGLTSPVKMRQMGVDRPIHGSLWDEGAFACGSLVPAGRFIHPRVEAEIAVVTGRPLRGPGCHLGAALAAVDFVLPAAEIIDSRYEAFRFDLASVIADNTSAAGFLVGGRSRRPGAVDLRTTGVVLEKNGAVVATGAGAAVLGHPAASLAMLADMLAEQDDHVPAGTLVLTGGITAAVEVAAGDHLTVRCQGLGALSFAFG